MINVEVRVVELPSDGRNRQCQRKSWHDDLVVEEGLDDCDEDKSKAGLRRNDRSDRP